MSNPHSPDYIRKSASFFTDRSVDTDMSPFSNRKPVENGMFYNADGAGESTASQEPAEDAEKAPTALEMVEESNQDKYAQVHQAELLKSGSRGRALAALGAGAGITGLLAGGTAKMVDPMAKEIARQKALAEGGQVDLDEEAPAPHRVATIRDL